MAEKKDYTISVVAASTASSPLSPEYMRQLTAYMEECPYLKTYEIVVADSTGGQAQALCDSLPGKVRYIAVKEGAGYIACINAAVFASCMSYVLLLRGHAIPAPDYFNKVFPVFSGINNVFGVGAPTVGRGGKTEGAKTPAVKGGNIYFQEVFPQRKPSATLFLPLGNMVVDRRKLSMCAGFCDLFFPDGYEQIDLCMRAWRLSSKCVYMPQTSCTDTSPDGDTEEHVIRTPEHVANRLMLNYLHSSGLRHFKFWARFASFYACSLVMRNPSWRSFKKSAGLFLDRYSEAHSLRKWRYKLYHSTIEMVAARFFPAMECKEFELEEKE